MAVDMIIVEDEILVSEGIERSVNWEELGIRVAAKCTNGLEALSYFKEHRPRIVITDIRMPQMNGIQLLKEIKAIDEHAIVIILSCSDDFCDAQAALKYGADDYILKTTMDLDSLQTLAQNIRAWISKYNQIERSNLLLEKTLRDSQHMKQRIGKDLLFGALNQPALHQLLRELSTVGIRIQGETAVLSIKYTTAQKNEDPFHICSLFEQNYVLPVIRNGLLYLLVDLGDAPEPHPANTAIALIIRLLAQYCLDYVVGISCASLGSDYAAKVQQAESALEHAFFSGSKSVSYFKDLQRESAALCSIHLPPFERAISEKNVAVFFELFDAAFESILSCRDRTHLNLLSAFLINALNAALVVRGDDRLVDQAQFQELISAQEQCRFLRSQFELFYKAQDDSPAKENTSHYIEIAMTYIKQNYALPIKLADIARKLYISENYLGTIFSQSLKKSFTHYLNEFRVQKAKLLLSKTLVSIEEIARSTGYSDAQYFCRVFKRLEKTSPLQYRKQYYDRTR